VVEQREKQEMGMWQMSKKQGMHPNTKQIHPDTFPASTHLIGPHFIHSPSPFDTDPATVPLDDTATTLNLNSPPRRDVGRPAVYGCPRVQLLVHWQSL